MVLAESLEKVEFRPSPVQEVQKFVTRMWEHPLLDQKTIQHRQRGKDALATLFSANNLSDLPYVGVPVGSEIWIVDQNSDFDFIVFTPHGYKLYAEIGNLIQSVGNNTVVHIINAFDSVLKDGKPLWGDYISILLTPDEYVLGDAELARQLRHSLVDKLEREQKADALWSLATDYGNSFRSWPHSTEKRRIRFEKQLRARSERSSKPHKWQRYFQEAAIALELPPFAVYRDAIRQTNGALHLNPRYKAINLIGSEF